MTRAHFSRKATDDQGNVVPGTTVTIYEASTLAPVSAKLYVNEVGSVERTNPFVVNDGVIDFYMDAPRQVKVGLRAPNGVERFHDDQDVYPDPQTVVQAPFGLQINNAPQPGQFLQATGQRQATWVDQTDLVTAALTPVTTLLDKTFSTETILPLTLHTVTGAIVTPTYADVALDTKPPGFTFVKALDWSTTQPLVLSTSSLLFAEQGTIQFLYKIIEPAAGESPATLRVSLDDGALWTQTAVNVDEYDVWRIGYLPSVPIGSRLVHFRHIPGTDPLSRVLLGAVTITYGGAVPAHAHEGGGLLSTAVGTNASANYDGATALGGESVVAGTLGTAVGALASARKSGTAVGASASATDEAIAVGYQARTHQFASAGVALGYNASVQASAGVAAGPSAMAIGAAGVAIGKDTVAAQDSVAIGKGATATADSSVAIGAATTATHARAVALGPGAQTTAADQVVLGTGDTTTIVPGSLDLRGDAVIGASGSAVGFYGAPGITRPVVSGSRGGNALLGALITHLADLGLIDDQTTA